MGLHEFDFTLLKKKIREMFGTIQFFAEEMDLSPISLSRKLNNRTQFKSDEIMFISDSLGIALEDIPTYFYKKIK